MKIFSIIVFNCSEPSKPVILARSEDLSQFGFWKRGTVREVITFVSRQLASRTSVGQRNSVFHDMQEPVDGVNKLLCHCAINAKNVGYVVITDGEYPQRTAYGFGHKTLEMVEKDYGDKLFSSNIKEDQTNNVNGLDTMIVKYQNPNDVDAVAKIQKDLDETRDVMVQNIDKLLQRGEKIDDLLSKTEDLSASSKVFMKKAQSMNGCCNIL